MKIGIFKAIYNASQILSMRDRRLYWISMVLQACLGLLDLLGVALLGAIGALTIKGVQSQQPGDRVQKALNFLNIENLTFQMQVGILGIAAICILIIKTLISIKATKLILNFLAKRSADTSSRIVSKLLSQPVKGLEAINSHELQYAIGSGVNAIVLGILGTSLTVIADFSLLIILGLAIFMINPLVALVSAILLGGIGFLLYLMMYKRASKLGEELSLNAVQSQTKLFQALLAYREIFVRNKRYYFISEISKLRHENSRLVAEQTFLPNMSKYIFEVTLTVGTMLVAATLFVTQDASRAAAGLAVFLAAGSRLAPSILRLQQNTIQIQGSIGASLNTMKVIASLDEISDIPPSDQDLSLSHEGFSPRVKISNLRYTFPDTDRPIFKDLNLEIQPGEFVAIVGPSGAGKSTLVDLILGLNKPEFGQITISEVNSNEAVEIWPGAIGYVPQNIGLIDATLAENIAIGFSINEITIKRVNEVLQAASLSKFVRTQPEGINTQIGISGSKVSGGQRQRIGIARALFTNPQLLILDEATSSLDAETESELSEMFSKLKGNLTLITIAHRLSTIRLADRVIYVDNGSILAAGKFEEVKTLLPDFAKQAKLMGA